MLSVIPQRLILGLDPCDVNLTLKRFLFNQIRINDKSVPDKLSRLAIELPIPIQADRTISLVLPTNIVIFLLQETDRQSK
jgi:hypothetical protein